MRRSAVVIAAGVAIALLTIAVLGAAVLLDTAVLLAGCGGSGEFPQPALVHVGSDG